MARRFGMVLAALAMLGLSATLIYAGPTAAQKCAVAKSKAAGKKFAAKLKCNQKAILKGQAVEPNCLTAAESKFNTEIQKAEAKGGCVVTGDANALEGAVDSCVGSIATLTPTVACQAANISCRCGNGTAGSTQTCGAPNPEDCATVRTIASENCALNGAPPDSCATVPCTDACTGQTCG